ncbi:brefeldin A-inhibited guanine nucleotide-exchange protein 3 [Ixodes scapularis]|uniref:brefeldin A-inhibited guanine nucleotide-exchange protein 3 n=1 Tax=Ixodes scapularis TaxID=6945 RepID=UPI001A9F999F|nr:brefeldin A-inhibited guanine nucleotide-exchange protein 3 [Ixodes scapularis]
MQQLLREQLFNPNFESDDEELWLPSQLMRAVSSLNSHSEEVQVEGLKVLMQCTCLQNWCLSQNTVLAIAKLCLDIYGSSSAAAKTAAITTASQTVQAYVCFLFDSSVEDARDDEEQRSLDEGCDTNIEGHISPFDEIVPLLSFFCEKLKEEKRGVSSSTTTLLLQCIQTALSSLKGQAKQSQQFLDFVWQQLCPRLVGCLGSPLKDKNIVSAQRFEKGEMGRGSGCLATAPSCQGDEAKLVYGIAVELVKVVGAVGALRPVLGSLFHRMLLYPLPQHCLEPLKFVKEMLKNPEQLLQFAGPPLWEDTKNPRLSDLDLLKIVVDGLGECCHSNDPNVCYVSVECVVALLTSLETLISGARISEEMAERINTTYPTLQSADYVGASFLLEKSARVGFTNGWQPSSTEKGTFPVSSHTLLSNLERVILERHKDNCLPRDESPPRSSPVERALEACEEFDMESLDSVPRASNEKEMDIEASGKEEEELDRDVDKENTDPEHPGECPEHPENLGDTLDPGGTNATEADENAVEEPSEGNDPIQPDEEEFVQSRNDEDLDAAESLDAEMSEKDFGEEPDDMHVVHEKASEPLMKDANRSERERLERFFESNDKFAERERKTAREFVGRLSEFLPRLLHIRSSIEADQDLQQFASDYSEALWQQQQQHSGPSGSEDGPHHITIVNADGIYLATYSALLLDLKLIHSGYYQGLSTDVPLTEEKFIEEVHGSGVLVYLSATWLSELYQQVLLRSLLEGAGYEPDSRTNHSLINLLTDMDGLESDQLGSRQLSDYRRLERASTNVELTPSMLAGMKFARRVLTTCWDTMLEVLCVLLNGTNSCGVASSLGLLLGTDGAKEDRRKAREAVADCLDGLQRAAKLYNVLGLQTKCGAIFAQLAAASCPSLGSSAAASSEMRRAASKRDRLRNTVLPGRSKAVRLHSSHVLSMDVLLSRGLELGSHSAVCWPHVFRCCCYILELERSCFQGKSSVASQLKLQFSAFSRCDKKQPPASPKPSSDSLVLQPPTECYEDEAMLEPAPMPGSVSVQSMSVADMVKSSTQAAGSCVLSGKQLEPIVEALSQLVDRLFDEAAGKLNLCALVGFLSELCAASRAQLFSKGQQQHQHHQPNQGGGAQYPLLLLNRLSEVMLRCARGGRPLVHIMKAWSIVAPHFVEVACHKDQVIAKRAVASIHDIVGALLSAHIDLPHFHFNEALFKPFENILCLELCDVDIQEQIVSSICEFVEGSTAEIRSGWRPLFGALRAVRMPGSATVCCPQRGLGGSEREQLERTHHLRVVLDVFDAFLGTDNPGVFANAAVDCLLCLLKHVRGPTELQDLGEGEATFAQELDAIPLNLCQAALKYLERCAQMLSSMYLMPACPVFHSAIRIKFNLEPNCVDPVIPDMELILFREHDSVSEHSRKGSMTDEGDDKVWYVQNDMDEDIELLPANHTVSLEELDRPTGVLHVWFLLLEGLAGAVATCPRKYQPHTIDTLFQMLRGLRDVPGPEFGVYAVNHLLLPMLQGWLRRAAKTHRGWDGFATNFKQCCGLATELVVDYLTQLSASGTMCQVQGLHLMVHQLFLVLTECIAQPAEVISRLGCACIRHLLVSGAPSLSPELWRVATWSVARASRATLRSAQQLMVCFHADSDNFYGDVGQAKVAVRRDCGPLEADRLRQLCRQVFLLDAQRAGPTSGRVRDVPPGVDDQCSFIFLLHPPDRLGDGASADPDACVIRVPFRSLVVGLLSHQILLQTLATLLLEGTPFRLPALASVLGCPPSPRGHPGGGAERRGSADTPQLAGQLGRLPEEELLRLLDVLGESHTTATDFDERPGLKFLVQKVAQAEVAANLFKQAAISWAVQAVVLLELCLRKPPREPLSMHLVDRLVASHRDGGDRPPARARKGHGNAEDELHEEDKGPSVSEQFADSDRCSPLPDRASTSSSCFASDADGSANSPARLPRRTSNLSERRLRRRRQHARRGSDSFGVVEHTVSREGPDSQEGGRTLNWNPFGRLRQLFQELCVHYARVASPEAKGNAIVDQVGDQPIFYLMAQPDTLPEILPHGDRREGVGGGSPSGHRPSSTDSDSSSEPAADPPSEERTLEPDRVYTVVTEKTIQSMVSEYKRRKTRHSMPPASAAAAAAAGHRSRAAFMRSRSVPAGNEDGASSVGSPPPSSPPPQSTAPPLPKEVENQRKCSILKDAEAHVQVWSQLAQSVLELHLSLKEPEFLALVPVFYSGVEALIGAAPSEPELRVLAADWLHRVALGLGFSGDSAVAARRC